jgi:hypothetical protein
MLYLIAAFKAFFGVPFRSISDHFSMFFLGEAYPLNGYLKPLMIGFPKDYGPSSPEHVPSNSY